MVVKMIKIIGNTIEMTRGDTFIATVGITDSSGEAYTPAEGDAIRFALKKDYKGKNPLITKTIPNGSLVLQLNPADTKALCFGNYVYDIELTHENGVVDTFISGKFVLLPEVD